jgi:branched-chain amino acid transport system ATP-binding protein
MLELSAVEAAYGPGRVLFGVDLTVGEGEVVTLMGRNGMGKTTTVRAIMGLNPATAGTIRFDGADITGFRPEAVARLGIGLVPEGRHVFRTLSVRENLVATAANRLGRRDPWTLDRVAAMFPVLADRAGQRAGTLSGGEQQMLAIGRALMTNPRLLILDEATEGLAPVVRAEIWRCLAALKAEGQSILVIDKNIAVLKRLADRHHVLEKGRTVWSGDAAALEADADTVRAHVGL